MSLKQLLILQQDLINTFDVVPYHEEFVNYDLIEHPENLEDQYHHYESMMRHQGDHQAYDAYSHTHGYEGHGH